MTVTRSDVDRLTQRLVVNAQIVGLGEALQLALLESAKFQQDHARDLTRAEHELLERVAAGIRNRRASLTASSAILELPPLSMLSRTKEIPR